MTKIYRKTGTIKAEQFDNSREMAEKYHVEYDGASYILPFRIETPKGWLEIKVGDWILVDDDDEYWPIAEDVFNKTYAELPVIPKYVAEYIDIEKSRSDVIQAGIDAIEYSKGSIELTTWIEENGDTFARAWLDGFQTEGENGN